MIHDTKKLVLLAIMLSLIGLTLAAAPQQVAAADLGTMCFDGADGPYDSREGSNYNNVSETVYVSRKAQYIDDYGHKWGSCKNGSVPVAPTTVSEACNSGFLGFPAWYRGLTNSSCDIESPGNNLSGFIWKVALNVIEMAMMAVAYIAVFFILYGGFQFLTSQGAPDGMAKARTTILNAVIGLVISLVAVGIINFLVTGLLI